MQSLHGKIKALRSVSRRRGEGYDENSENLKSGVGRNPMDRAGRDDTSGLRTGRGLEIVGSNEQVTIDILDDSSRQNDGVSSSP